MGWVVAALLMGLQPITTDLMLPALPALRRRLWWMPLNLANPVWVDAAPDLSHHIVEHRLPRPAAGACSRHTAGTAGSGVSGVSPSSSAILKPSCSLNKLQAIPELPARPVRPIRWV